MTTFMTDPRRIDTLEEYALRNCAGLNGSDLMPRHREILESKGLVFAHSAGRHSITPEGVAALKAHGEAQHDESLRSNVIPQLGTDGLATLGRVIRGEALAPEEARSLSGAKFAGSLHRTKEGWQVTSHGRQVYALAHGRST